MSVESQLLRFTTAGSVDDGKSTLIGRLLYEAKGVYEDQLASVRNSSVNRSTGPIDFSLLTDGLRAEREQGITIDVAYRYAATPRRKFIIADTPGHEQYTRNMATGASTADLAIVLIDARKGVLVQSRRHAFITALLGIRYVAVAVNKMDLVDFREDVFRRIETEFSPMPTASASRTSPSSPSARSKATTSPKRAPGRPGTRARPCSSTSKPLTSARVTTSPTCASRAVRQPSDPRLPRRTCQLASGILRPGQTVMTLPSGRITKVKSLPSFDGDLAEAYPPMSVTVCLEDEVDISRGDMLVDPARVPDVSRRFAAKLVWMHETRAKPAGTICSNTPRKPSARRLPVSAIASISIPSPNSPPISSELNEIASIQDRDPPPPVLRCLRAEPHHLRLHLIRRHYQRHRRCWHDRGVHRRFARTPPARQPRV
jgi:sulfate adenylyltransferase subunit 1 (EFTu-like GTPase family)